jgi:hypothetical protein
MTRMVACDRSGHAGLNDVMVNLGIFGFGLSCQLDSLSPVGLSEREETMRKITVAAIGFAVTALAWGYSQAATEVFKGTLSGASEVPPVVGTGTGSATVNFDTATKQVTFSVTYTGLSGPAKAAHIHCGAAAGANAGVAVKFDSAASPISGSATLTDAQVADLEAGKCYVNIHTEANGGGELRAQLAK